MAPRRSNKGKQVVKYDVEFKTPTPTPKMTSIGQRVAFSTKIEVVVYSEGVDNFESLFKVSRKTFNYIRTLVRESMLSGCMAFTFTDRKPMTLNDQIGVALKRLSSVDSSINIAMLFETTNWTVDTVTTDFAEALEAHGAHHISWPSDIAKMKQRFKSINGMPNCYGAIETTHLKMYPRKSDGETTYVWLDGKNNNSMQLQVIVDPTMRFLDVFSGCPGCFTKVEVLEESEFFKLAQTQEILNGNEVDLPDGTKIPEYLVGDSGFQLLPWLITPYNEEELTADQTEFNRKHLATRLVAGCALKKLKEVWAVLEGGMWRPDRYKLPRIICACCILHNIQIEMQGDEVSNQFMNSYDHDSGYPPEISTLPGDENAAVVRDKLSLYLAGKLSV